MCIMTYVESRREALESKVPKRLWGAWKSAVNSSICPVKKNRFSELHGITLQMFAAVTTYLVVLLQFRFPGGKESSEVCAWIPAPFRAHALGSNVDYGGRMDAPGRLMSRDEWCILELDVVSCSRRYMIWWWRNVVVHFLTSIGTIIRTWTVLYY